jgi:D-3-phosphoglycerate dehydrogenase
MATDIAQAITPANKYKVLYTDTDSGDYSIEASVLDKIGARIIMASSLDEDALMNEGADCDAVMTLYGNISERVLNHWGRAGKVKVVCRQGIGYNNIDVAAATRNGIMVANVPDYCLDEVADHSVGLALALMRELKSFDLSVHKGEWRETPARPVRRTNTRVFGLVGLGNIGRRVAARVRAFGMSVICYDPHVKPEQVPDRDIELVPTLAELAERADFISLHLPQTEETRHIINLSLLEKMKPNAFIINTSRGGLISQNDLIYALDHGMIAGAGLDVTDPEPPGTNCPLLGRDNVILTSHVAFLSEEANRDLLVKIATNVADTLTAGRPRYLVNPEVLEL